MTRRSAKRPKRNPIRSALADLKRARAALADARFAGLEAEDEMIALARVANARLNGGTWQECAVIYGLPNTRKGAESARQKFNRSLDP